MKALDDSAVGVLLPLLSPTVRCGLEPFQLRFASRATRAHTPCGGMPFRPARNGVTLGSWQYIRYVDQRWSVMTLVHGAFLNFPLDLTPGDFPGKASEVSSHFCDWASLLSYSGLIQCASSDVNDIRLKSDALVWVDRAVDGLLDSHSGLDSSLL